MLQRFQRKLEKPEFRTITLRFSNWFLDGCDFCKKNGVLLNGMPSTADVSLVIEPSDLSLLYEVPFFVAPDLKYTCHNGIWHEVNGVRGKWHVSNKPVDIKHLELSEHLVSGAHLEPTLTRFFALYAEWIRSGVLPHLKGFNDDLRKFHERRRI